jgi:hypothetical protein
MSRTRQRTHKPPNPPCPFPRPHALSSPTAQLSQPRGPCTHVRQHPLSNQQRTSAGADTAQNKPQQEAVKLSLPITLPYPTFPSLISLRASEKKKTHRHRHVLAPCPCPRPRPRPPCPRTKYTQTRTRTQRRMYAHARTRDGRAGAQRRWRRRARPG